MENIQTFWKQFVGWVTDFRYRYTNNIFFRTTVHVVLIQTLLALLLIAAFAGALFYMSKKLILTVILYMTSMLRGDLPVDTAAFTGSISAIQVSTILLIFFGVVVLTVIFGIILSYITLRPARNSLRQQKLFISNVAHELRTPLSIIKTTVEVRLLDEDVHPNEQQSLNEINEEVDRISQIVNNLLSLNQLLRPERIEFGNIDMVQIVKTVVHRIEPLSLARDVSITIQHNKSTVPVWGNASALEQVITNIIRNSISYMDPKKQEKHVHVTTSADSGQVAIISITDNGIGIHQNDLLHIFEPFYRASTARSRSPNMSNKGSGLGLAIVSEIIRIHHGKIHMQSAPGKGTTTTLYLPSTPHTNTAAVARKNTNANEALVDFSKDHGTTEYFSEAESH